MTFQTKGKHSSKNCILYISRTTYRTKTTNSKFVRVRIEKALGGMAPPLCASELVSPGGFPRPERRSEAKCFSAGSTEELSNAPSPPPPPLTPQQNHNLSIKNKRISTLMHGGVASWCVCFSPCITGCKGFKGNLMPVGVQLL